MTATNVVATPSVIDRVFGAPLEGQTWSNVLYLLLAFPLGVTWFVLIVTGISLGAGLALIFVGIPILVFTLMLAGIIARFERVLLRKLLGATIVNPRPAPVPPGIVESLKAYLTRPETWKAVVYIVLHLPFAVVAFGLMSGFLFAGAALFIAPLTYTFLPMDVCGVRIATLDQAVLCCSLGAIVTLVGLHVMNGLAGAWKHVGSALLQ